MNILGMCGGIRLGNWDAAAAIVVDGRLLAAAEEERFTRVKHAPGNFPTHAITYCLDAAGLKIEDVDVVVFPGSTYVNMRERIADYFTHVHGYAPRIELCDHHDAHAASTFFTSGLDEALVVTFDFSGDGRATTISKGSERGLEPLASWPYPQSLGVFYALITQHLGFDFGEDEYKVMGLASYGEPTTDLSWLLRPGDGTYELAADVLRSTVAGEPPLSPQERFYSAALEARLGLARPKREPLRAEHENLAASAQRQLEETVLRLIRPYAAQVGTRSLCLAGGVAMNGVMNQKLAECGDFDDVFLSPASGDAGLAMGAALLLAHAEDRVVRERLRSGALGPDHSDDEIRQALDEVGARATVVDDPAVAAADAIASGRIVGWYQGRIEYGARALGQRSILADPRDATMKDRVNAVVKFREGFRPFAPSVLEEAAGDYYERIYPCPFMTSTFTVKPSAIARVPATTHVDGTARVQTVGADASPLYHRVISEVGARTGVPIVLNTSFNIKGQPIVENPQQAISTFFGSGLDVLVAGSFVVDKSA